MPKELTKKSLAIARPDLAKEWDFHKNNEDPSLVPEFSNEIKWWVCKFKHSWSSTVANRSQGRGCSQCRLSKEPTILKDRLKNKHGIDEEWLINNYLESDCSLHDIWRLHGIGHTVVRGALKLYGLEKSPKKIVRVKNSKRDSTNLERYGSSNPHSFSGRISSFEIEMAEYLNKLLVDDSKFEFTQSDTTVINPKELDFYFHKIAVAIEFNGNYWHNKDRWLLDLEDSSETSPEALKTRLCLDKEVRLIHIWEDDWSRIVDKKDFLRKIIEGD